MTHNLGEKLKSLRKKHDLTQEQLAERLGVSFQAISKWETNAAVPDISMFPVLANFYRVTTDELLGVDITLADKKITQYENDVYDLLSGWKLAEAVETARKACGEFPGSDNLRYLLAHTLEQAQNNIRTKEENISEAIEILEEILETSRDTDLREVCLSTLVRMSHYSGNDEKALRYADQLPKLSHTQECSIIRMGLKKGAGRVQYVRYIINRFYNCMDEGIKSLCGVWPYEESEALLPEEQISLLESMFALQSVIYGNDLLSENMNAMVYAYTKAAANCRIGNKAAALNDLEAAVSHAEKFAAYDEKASFCSPLQKGCAALKRSHWSRSAFEDLYDELSGNEGKKKYAALQEHPGFQALLEKVRQAAMNEE